MRPWPLLLLALAFAQPAFAQPAASPPAPAAAASGKGPGVTHVVIVWLKDPASAEARQKVLDAAGVLRHIPGVQDVHAGRMVPSTRPVVDSTFTVAFVMRFADVDTMKAYLANPVHVKEVNEVLKPLADHYTVYDFQDE